MRKWLYLHVLVPIRYFLVGDVLAELAALRAQLGAVETLAAMSKNIETAMLTITAQMDDTKKPHPSSSNLQRPSA
jgi:hypothetical protein